MASDNESKSSECSLTNSDIEKCMKLPKPDSGHSESGSSFAASKTIYAASASGGSRGTKRGPTSWVWDHMSKKSNFMKDGQNVGDRAVCNYCQRDYSPIVNHGTGSMDRHLKKHHVNEIKKVTSGSTNFVYSEPEMRKGLVRYIASADRPFTFGDDIRFEDYVKKYVNPNFKRVSTNTTREDALYVFGDDKIAKIREIGSLGLGSTMSFTSNIWSSEYCRDYLCLTAHYIDDSWKLNKRTLGFRLMDPHDASNIIQIVNDVFREYNVSHKFFSIILDNDSANIASIELFKQCLTPFHGGELFHMRCVCHIINLVVQDGLVHIGPQLEKIRYAMLFISSPSRQQGFDALCATMGLKKKNLEADFKNRWNSTYLMLKSCRKHHHVISDFVNGRSQGDNFSVSPIDWKIAFDYMRFLEVFYSATVALSGVVYPTSCLVLKYLHDMTYNFRFYRSQPNFELACKDMEEKFKKYFDPIPPIFILAAVMDPKIKLKGVEKILNGISTNLAITLHSADDVLSLLNDVYASYESKYGSKSISSNVLPCETENIDDPASSLLSNTTSVGGTSRSQLSDYLQTEFFTPSDIAQDFNILGWWKTHETTFPILHIMARDVLTPPAFSVASEYAFSTGKRVLDDERARLSPDILDCLMCLKDWEDARLGIHPPSAKEDFRDYFADSDIDDD